MMSLAVVGGPYARFTHHNLPQSGRLLDTSDDVEMEIRIRSAGDANPYARSSAVRASECPLSYNPDSHVTHP